MPKQVDHDERRNEIAAAVWRIASERGLEDVTMRQVAAEAGVSMRLVQYYFGTRHDLLLKALEILNKTADTRAKKRIPATIGEPTPRAILRGVILEVLPLDEERRMTVLVYLAYFVRSLHDEQLAAAFRANNPDPLEQFLASLIKKGQEAGDVPADRDARKEADLLWNSVDGLQTSLLLGHRTEQQVMELIEYQLDRIFVR